MSLGSCESACLESVCVCVFLCLCNWPIMNLMSSGKQEAAGGSEPPVILITSIQSILHQRPVTTGAGGGGGIFQAFVRYEK